jgi:hypothetical protein
LLGFFASEEKMEEKKKFILRAQTSKLIPDRAVKSA